MPMTPDKEALVLALATVPGGGVALSPEEFLRRWPASDVASTAATAPADSAHGARSQAAAAANTRHASRTDTRRRRSCCRSSAFPYIKIALM